MLIVSIYLFDIDIDTMSHTPGTPAGGLLRVNTNQTNRTSNTRSTSRSVATQGGDEDDDDIVRELVPIFPIDEGEVSFAYMRMLTYDSNVS